MSENIFSTIDGKRVRLRDWSEADVPDFEAWQRPGHLWQTLDGPYYRSEIDDSRRLAHELSSRINLAKFPEPRAGLVIADIKTNYLLGTVTSYWESKETHWLCIGIIIYDSESWGKGLGYESLGLWIEYLFKKHPMIVRLDMRTWSGNLGLISLAKKHGFTQEACFRKARIVNGEYFDGLGFGILRSEWVQAHPGGFG